MVQKVHLNINSCNPTVFMTFSPSSSSFYYCNKYTVHLLYATGLLFITSLQYPLPSASDFIRSYQFKVILHHSFFYFMSSVPNGAIYRHLTPISHNPFSLVYNFIPFSLSFKAALSIAHFTSCCLLLVSPRYLEYFTTFCFLLLAAVTL